MTDKSLEERAEGLTDQELLEELLRRHNIKPSVWAPADALFFELDDTNSDKISCPAFCYMRFSFDKTGTMVQLGVFT